VTEVNKTENFQADFNKISSIKFHANTLVGAKLFKVDKQAGGPMDEQTATFATS
jgi:hypothetical protein